MKSMEMHSQSGRLDDVGRLIHILPPPLQQALADHGHDELIEVVLDLGRAPQARYPARAVALSSKAVTAQALEDVIARVGEFGGVHRAGIERTLHRISAIRNRRGRIIGLTLRVGRAVAGTIDPLRDLLEDGRSLLLLGRPGVGKTTMLREIARVLADEHGKRVIVIDTSNEIAGDGDIPHPAIGSARRMQVPRPEMQHAVMIEAVENHMPEVIIIDEIGTEEEARAARTIAERGVQLIATAHGNTLENLIQNPTLSDLVGGVQAVTLSDEEARFRGTQKTVLERKAPPTFEQVVELISWNEMVVHKDTAAAVDAVLRGEDPGGIRRTPQGEEVIRTVRPARAQVAELPEDREVRIYPYALSRDLIERVIRSYRFAARTVPSPDHADLVLTQKARASDRRLEQLLEQFELPLYIVKKGTTAQVRRALNQIMSRRSSEEEAVVSVEAVVAETEAAIRKALEESTIVRLAPQPEEIRELQLRIVDRYHLSASEEPTDEGGAQVVIYPY